MGIINQFSKKSDKFKEGENVNRYGLIWIIRVLGWEHLYMWAKEDNLEKFNELTKNDLRKYINKSLNVTPFAIAVVMYQMFKDEFVYAPKKHGISLLIIDGKHWMKGSNSKKGYQQDWLKNIQI